MREDLQFLDQKVNGSSEQTDVFTPLVNEFLRKSWQDRYDIYLSSERWLRKRAKILERDHHLCQSCLENKATEVHHLTYERVGCELLQDLVSLCKDCHRAITRMRRIKIAEDSSRRWTNGKPHQQDYKVVYGTLGDFLVGNGIDSEFHDHLIQEYKGNIAMSALLGVE